MWKSLKRESRELPVTQFEMRSEIGFLGMLLGDIVRQFAGNDTFDTVEELRRIAWARRVGQEGAERRMTEIIAGLGNRELHVVIRAFSIFLDLLNIVEDRKRVKVLRERAADAYPEPPLESIGDAILELKAAGKSINELQRLLERLKIELVFTAHPTDAKRRSIRHKLTRLRELLTRRDRESMPAERTQTEQQMRAELAKWWQTDFIRPWRPSVLQEVGRGLSIKPVLWDEVPKMLGELQRWVTEYFDGEVSLSQPCLTFGSWIGGDRDGHPGVTAEVTEQTFVWLRQEALKFHLAACDQLFDSLSLSQRQMHISDALRDAVTTACETWPHLEQRIAAIPPFEICRRYLEIIHWRLQQTEQITLAASPIDGAYACPLELRADVDRLFACLAESTAGELVASEVRAWLHRIDAFGFHLARLDIRQNAHQYREVVEELLQHAGICDDPHTLDERARQRELVRTLGQEVSLQEQSLSPLARETLNLFRLLHRVVNAFGVQAIGGQVISMTGAASDVLTVLWFWKLTEDKTVDKDEALPIAPLFETIEDLQQGPGILAEMLAIDAYRQHLKRQSDWQVIMLGYSDSTKDGGYLSACWWLHEAQKNLSDTASSHGVQLTFFHGRGGSLGRGGGPAARSILSLPSGTFRGSLRLTEQGEVLADRYDDPAIAHRHLEQVLWSSLLAAGKPAAADNRDWSALMEQLSEVSYQNYRQLIEQVDFVAYFRQVTPISEIERLPIGSRPSRRRGEASLSDLRAIPWVFSWTQSRCLIPAWYGIGSAIGPLTEDPGKRETLREMYQQWPFFRACIDNAELALAKSDLSILQQYAKLASNQAALAKIASTVAEEYRQSCDAVLALTEKDELLDGTPWLKESIRVRNRYIDPLNFIQVELLRRGQGRDVEDESESEWRHLTRLTINGIAAGMRTSG